MNIYDVEFCPECGVRWRQEETIFEYFLKQCGDEKKARETAEMYGCTPESPKHFGTHNFVMLSSLERDMVYAYRCTACGAEWDRFTGEKRNENACD